jgi:hypothetical protein
VIARSKLLPLLVLFALMLAAPAVADAATLAVDDDGAQCPAAEFTMVQAAVDAAAPGDTIAVCPGVYVEGSGAVGTNALTITKDLTIKGAGADLVAIEPKRSTPTGGQIAEASKDIRNGRGDIVAAVGATAVPITVNISGVTVDGNGVFAEAGVVYLDAQGELARDRVTHIVTSISNPAYELPGGYRSNQFGYGIAQVTAAQTAPVGAGPRALVIDHTRVDEYNKVGILISGATGESAPLTSSGVVNSAVLESDQVIGRVQCLPFNTPTPPPYVLGGAGATPTNQLPGNCSSVGLTTTGPTYGQDGVRVSGGAKVAIKDTTIAQNLVNGAAAPAYGATTNNENLSLGAGLRLIGAGSSTVTHSNITDNAYGAYNVGLDGTTPNTANPLGAIENWWGLNPSVTTSNTGPAISPTTNPKYQENPVNGSAEADGSGTTSNAVDFFPFRNGSEADPNTGEWPVVYAPLPVNDAAPTISLATDKPAYLPGATVTLTATASDDFGVTEITFYEGTTPIATVIPPADTATVTIPTDAACAARTVSAVASDFLGQTGSATAAVVGGPNECKEPETPGGGGGETPGGGGGTPPPASPQAPTVSLVSPPATIGEAGATLTATPAADTAAGVSIAKVDFFLGNRLLCTVTAAPFICKVLPGGAEVGTQALRAVITDSAGQTAAAEASTKVQKFTPTDLTLEAEALKVKSKGKPKLRRKLSGKLKLPDRVTPGQGCASGTVSITVSRDGKTVLPSTQVDLGAKCTYSLTLTVPAKSSKSTFKATAKFGGNAVLLPASTTRRFH